MSDQQMNEVPLPQEGGVAQAVPVPAAPLPGALLLAQRQRKGWSIEQVASLVKLAPRQIQAIESDNYAALPGLAVARGFVRSYAKSLGLDANAIVAGVPQDSPVAQRDHIVPQHQLSTPFSETPLPAMMMSNRGNGGNGLTIAVGVLVAAVVVGAAAVRWTDLGSNVAQLAWLKPHPAEPATDAAPADGAATDAGATDTPVNARVETIDPAAAKAADVLPAPTDNTSLAAVASASQPTQPTQMLPSTPSASVPASPASASAPASVPAPAAAPAAPAPVAAASAAASALPPGLNIVNSKDLLRLTFREDSWVEIRRADKSTIISRLLKAGTTETFDVSDATMLVVGNASGVDATLRGKALDLKSGSGNNVARLNLN